MLDRQLEQRLQRRAQLVDAVVDPEVVQPRRRAQAHAARAVADQAVAGHERGGSGQPVHRLAEARERERVDPRGHRRVVAISTPS